MPMARAGRGFSARLSSARNPFLACPAPRQLTPCRCTSVSFQNFFIAGRPEPPLDALPIADQSNVSPGYFIAIGLRLETGRWFTGRDLEAAESGHAVVAVNRAFVRKFFPNENPLGKILLDGDNKTNSEIVAVVSVGVDNYCQTPWTAVLPRKRRRAH
jgi:hypothetical protein